MFIYYYIEFIFVKNSAFLLQVLLCIAEVAFYGEKTCILTISMLYWY